MDKAGKEPDIQIAAGADAKEQALLGAALRGAYPVTIAVDLKKNEYRVLTGAPHMRAYGEAGCYDTLIKTSASRMTTEDSAEELINRFRTEALLRSLSEGRSVEETEYLQRQLDGREHWIELSAYLFGGEGSSDSYAILLIRYIDLEKENERRLKQELRLTNDELTRERRYQQQLDEHIPAATLIFKPGDPITLMHAGGTLLGELGYDKSELQALFPGRLGQMIHEDDLEKTKQYIKSAMQRRDRVCEQEFRARGKSGKLLWVYAKCALIQADDGQDAYLCVLLDVTKRKELEERLRVSEDEINLAMSRMGKMICIFDARQRTLTMPEAYATKHGLPTVLDNIPYSVDARGLIGDEETRGDFFAFYQAILRGERTGASECFLKCADGTWCWEHGEFVTIFGSDQKPAKAIVSVEDTTQRHQLSDENEALKQNEQVFRVVAKHSSRVILRYDIDKRTARMDEAAQQRFGYPDADTGLPESAIKAGRVLPESADDFRAFFRSIHQGKPDGSAKIHVQRDEGTRRWLDIQYTLVAEKDGKPRIAVISQMDVTDIHERELAYERYRQTVQREDGDRRVMFFESDLTNDVIERVGGELMTGGLNIPRDDRTRAVEMIVDKYVAPGEREACLAFFSREHLITTFTDGARTLKQDWRVVDMGDVEWLEAELQMIRDPYTGNLRIYTVLRDVTKERAEAISVRRQAERDGMTGLYNRSTTERLIKKRLQDQSGAGCALMICDLDDLKTINDSMGHAQGDNAIRLIAKTLREHFRRTDIAGRIGGDEFLVYLEGTNDPARLRGVIGAMIHRLNDIRIGEEGALPLHISVGVAAGQAGGDTFASLYQRADKALYHVKRNGKNNYALYTEAMEAPNYQFTGHSEVSLWKTDYYDQKELKRLLFAISSIYPLVVSVNLTKNSYSMMEYDSFTTTVCEPAGRYDELIENGAKTYHPDDRESFRQTFCRESQLAAYARGERRLTHRGRQLGDDGIYRAMRTEVIFTGQDSSGDLLQISFSRKSRSAE